MSDALVTGASRGVGLALVSALLTDRSVERVFAASREAVGNPALIALASSYDRRLFRLDLDVSDEKSVSAAANTMRAETGRLDLIINCAGVLHNDAGMQPEKRLADVSTVNLERSFAVNAVGPLLIAKHCQTLLDNHRRAVFASLSARVGSIGDNRLGGWYAYRAAKAAQNMITKNLSIELRRKAKEIICVALHPGTVDTELSQPFQRDIAASQLH